MTKLEIAGSVIGVIAFVFTMGAGWDSINSRFDRVDERLEDIEKDGTDELCLQVVQRQMVAIEKGNESVKRQLDRLARERGCVHRMELGENAAFTIAATQAQMAARKERERQERMAFQAQLHEIDQALKTFPPSQDPISLSPAERETLEALQHADGKVIP